MRRAVTTIALLAVALSAIAAPPSAAQGSYTASEHFFPSADGTMLHADVFMPDGVERAPVILLVTPYRLLAAPTGNPGLAYPSEFQRFLLEGYAIHQVSLRGYGESDGCGDFGGVGEQADAVAAVEWSAAQEWSTGKVGMWGISYDGWTQVMAMANGAKGLSAAVVSSPLISLYRGLYMDGVHYGGGWHSTPASYAAIDLASVGKPTPNDPGCYAANTVETNGDDPTAAYWRERNLIPKAKDIKVPIFWTHGFLDANTKPDNFLPVYSKLRGPLYAWFGQFSHQLPSPAVGRQGFVEEAIAFYDHFLKGERAATKGMHPVTVQDGAGRWRAEEQWPPSDAKPVALQLNEGSFEDMTGNDANETGTATNGIWTFTQRLPYDVHIAGIPKLDLDVDVTRGGAYLIALMYDVAPDGRARLITRGAHQFRGEGLLAPAAGRAEFEMYPEDWPLPKGHRLGLFLSASDETWFDPGHTLGTVTITSGKLKVPFLRYERDRFLEGAPSQEVAHWYETTVADDLVRSAERRGKLPPRLRKRGS
ncbi:MAG TPA: CocE/NonD family hydrolase [Actinomycetota bacterium]|nr:CocE/NonD family hydrolase [Actinomycetota bacterium]